MKNYRMFTPKYLPVTDTKPARVRITDTRFGVSKIIPRGDCVMISGDAIKYLQERNIEIIGRAYDEKTGIDYFFTDDFSTQIK